MQLPAGAAALAALAGAGKGLGVPVFAGVTKGLAVGQHVSGDGPEPSGGKSGHGFSGLQGLADNHGWSQTGRIAGSNVTISFSPAPPWG